jgi:hypothetical protein
MIHRYRTLLFLSFTLTFFIAASLVLFYAYGYRFSFERGIFIYTGSLSLKTNVETVSITIDGTTIPKKRLGLLNNSIHIAGLNPGEHFVEVSAPGYRSWAKKVVIQSGLTTEFWNVFLVEENYEQETVFETEGVIKMFPSLNGLFATVKKAGNRYSVDVLDPEAEKNEEVFATSDALFVPTLETNIEWSPESHKIMIPLVRDTAPLYAIVNVEDKETFFLNEATHLTTPLRSPRWDATTRDFLFFLSQNSLYRFNTSRPEDTPELIADHVAAYDISGNKLYYLHSESGIVYEMNGNGNTSTAKQITPTPVSIGEHGTYSLIVYDDTRLSIIEETTGSLFVYNKAVDINLKKLGEGILSIQYSDDGKKLLFYTNNEISVYFNQDWEAQPTRSKDDIIQLARFSTPLKNIQWAEDYEHVIFSLGKSVKMIELDNRDRRSLADLITLDTPPLQILSRFGTDRLYIVKEAAPNSTELPSVVSITLPQYATFFGL